ncbi:arginine--tRNA ligase [Haloplasma contractile]|uniref:Arginine--tRNA ligase n=1 Tax=Haloplasma contractile SSD-17B TaxID=1033810 RepID=U2EES7_9MOLU|nr:arginine--tRNA ligase [Haloplasma contractile]ERJ13201.1 Arginine--tRNA ligase protein [Haloplasma contractile SSD-17B]
MIKEIKLELETLLIEQYHYYIKIEEPNDRTLADIAIPLFVIAKDLKKKLPLIFDEIKDIIKKSDINHTISTIKFKNGYLNIKLNKDEITQKVIEHTQKLMKANTTFTKGKGKTVVFDYSSPNIAKSFSVGHLRSTIIGNALANIYNKLGFNVVRINHLGDWGTQFGKMIVAYEKWGNEDQVRNNPIEELSKLYVQFHNEAKTNTSLEDEARLAFALLEQGKEPYNSLWKWFREESLKEFMTMYHLLGVSFDSFNGEAFYNDQLESVVNRLEEKSLLKYDDGAYIVDLAKEEMPPAMIKKSDGASLYITRDLAALFYRKETYDFSETIYVVGNEQTLHFKQLKMVAKKLDFKDYNAIKHVNFGLVLQDGKKMSTRKGKIKKLYDVLKEAINQSKETILNKNSQIKNVDEVAKAIGVSAIIYNDLKNDRTRNVEFNLGHMLNFDGMTGPYLQYTRVRMNSILSKKPITTERFNNRLLDQSIYYELIYLIGQYEETLEKAKKQLDPSIIARYAYQIAKEFNKIYSIDKFLVLGKEETNTKLILLECTQFILDECLKILGMKILNKM